MMIVTQSELLRMKTARRQRKKMNQRQAKDAKKVRDDEDDALMSKANAWNKGPYPAHEDPYI